MSGVKRKARGFIAVEEIASSICNLAKITLTPGYEVNRKWKRNRECDLIIRVLSGSAMIEIGDDGPIFCL
jgi:uncharacterized RmlC-like cupin family protein